MDKSKRKRDWVAGLAVFLSLLVIYVSAGMANAYGDIHVSFGIDAPPPLWVQSGQTVVTLWVVVVPLFLIGAWAAWRFTPERSRLTYDVIYIGALFLLMSVSFLITGAGVIQIHMILQKAGS